MHTRDEVEGLHKRCEFDNVFYCLSNVSLDMSPNPKPKGIVMPENKNLAIKGITLVSLS